MPIPLTGTSQNLTFGTPEVDTGGQDSFSQLFGSGSSPAQQPVNATYEPGAAQPRDPGDIVAKFLGSVGGLIKDDEARIKAAEGKMKDAEAADASSADDTSGADDGSTGDDTSTDGTPAATPQQNAATLAAGDATGDPPDDLTLPPDTDVNTIIGANGGLIDKLNWHNTQQGVPVGDALAAKESGGKYTTMASLESAAKAGDPGARNALAKAAWAAQACNNVTEQDGAQRPDDERHASTLAGYTSMKGGDANHGTPAGIMQDYVQSGQSITGQTTLATDRTYADGTPKSNATIVGERIAKFFENVFAFICPPVGDLIKMAVDGATSVRDKKAGDADAAHHDDDTIKQDGKDFGKDFGEFAASLIGGPEMAEIGTVVRGVANGVKDLGAGLAKGAAHAGEDVEKGASRAADALTSMDLGSLADSFVSKVAQDMGLGDAKDALKAKIAKHPNAAALLDELRSQAQGFLQGQVQGTLLQPQTQGQTSLAA